MPNLLSARSIWEDLCDLMAHYQWTLIIHNNLWLAPKLTEIDHGFFKYISQSTIISTLQIRIP